MPHVKIFSDLLSEEQRQSTRTKIQAWQDLGLGCFLILSGSEQETADGLPRTMSHDVSKDLIAVFCHDGSKRRQTKARLLGAAHPDAETRARERTTLIPTTNR
jgi:hypothetical protein